MTSPAMSALILPKEDEQCRVLMAVPKKGRLANAVQELLVGSGFDYIRVSRLDVAPCKYEDKVTIVFLPAADIASYVGEGSVDIGITGQDIVGESGVDVEILDTLGMGKCKLCVQAPAGKYKSAAELSGKRIVTSFPNLARQYFSKLDTEDRKTSIKYVSGSVEAACSLGLADGIVDLVETGTTMRAAGLEPVGEVMKTQTVLIKNPHTKHPRIVNMIHKRISGYLLAKESAMVTYNIPRSQLKAAELITPGHEAPTVQPLDGEGDWVAVSALIKASEGPSIMDRLQDIGARSILTMPIGNCRF